MTLKIPNLSVVEYCRKLRHVSRVRYTSLYFEKKTLLQ